MIKLLSSITHAYSLLLQEEVQRECSHSINPIDSVAMNVKFHNNKGRILRMRHTDVQVQCDFRHLGGHTC